MESISSTPVLKFETGAVVETTDDLAREEPLEIRVRGRAISVTMRTPGHDAELAAGFLLTEGLIRHPSDILKIEPCDRNEHGNLINVLLAPHVHVDFDRLTRHLFASSSCGLCGKATIDAIRQTFPALKSDLKVDPAALLTMPALMRQAQDGFNLTGGLHAAGLFDAGARLMVLREDVGRHNAVDKVIGHALMGGLFPLDRHILLVSGRVSFEIVQKALAAGLAIVAAVSAPSSLAVQFASENGQTLVGFLRDGRLNVYCGAHRLGLGLSAIIKS